MSEKDRFQRFVGRYPHSHTPFFQRPYATRRQFFQLLGAGVTGAMLLRPKTASAAPGRRSHPQSPAPALGDEPRARRGNLAPACTSSHFPGWSAPRCRSAYHDV